MLPEALIAGGGLSVTGPKQNPCGGFLKAAIPKCLVPLSHQLGNC